MTQKEAAALELIGEYGQIDGAHHKQWLLDQIARVLAGDDYETWAETMTEWGEGVAP